MKTLAERFVKPAAAMGAFSAGKLASSEELGRIPVGPQQRRALAEARDNGAAVNVEEAGEEGGAPFAVVPILQDRILLGLIEVDKVSGASPVSEEELQTLESFALQAAVAINDARIRRDPRAWEDQLDEVLELDEEIGDDELFDRLGGETEK